MGTISPSDDSGPNFKLEFSTVESGRLGNACERSESGGGTSRALARKGGVDVTSGVTSCDVTSNVRSCDFACDVE
jgi:hypothetical protein